MSRRARRWLEVAVRTGSPGPVEGLLAEGLLVIGGRAVEERDGWLVTHVEAPADTEAFELEARRVLSGLAGSRDFEMRTGWRAHEDWAETWKRGLRPRRVTDRILVTPSWHDLPSDPPDVVIVLDPGMAFGTAEHGTTRGCLRLLDGVVSPGQRWVDVGAGSGILSIAAAGLGAEEVIALEGDPLAVEAMADNVTTNRCADRVQVRTAWADPPKLAALAPVDGIVANIESGVLRPLLPGFAAALRPGGTLILSGILEAEWPAMEESAVAQGFHTVEIDADGEWRSARLELVT